VIESEDEGEWLRLMKKSKYCWHRYGDNENSNRLLLLDMRTLHCWLASMDGALFAVVDIHQSFLLSRAV
jgi:hypothetical protein